MRMICFPHFYYLSEVSRLAEIGKALRGLGQDVRFFSHGGPYEHVAENDCFEVVSVDPQMSPERAEEYEAFDRAERGNPFRDGFFSYEELDAYVRSEGDALREVHADAVLIGSNLPSYLSVQLMDIPIVVRQPGPFTAPFFDRNMGVFVPSLIGWMRYLPMDWFFDWFMPRTRLWLQPFNRLASTLVMEAPEILGIRPEEMESCTPRHPEFFHRPPVYRCGGPCYAKLPGEIPPQVS